MTLQCCIPRIRASVSNPLDECGEHSALLLNAFALCQGKNGMKGTAEEAPDHMCTRGGNMYDT